MGVQMALDLVHRVKKTDLLTGLSTRTQGGRPDFDKVSEGGGGGGGERKWEVEGGEGQTDRDREKEE